MDFVLGHSNAHGAYVIWNALQPQTLTPPLKKPWIPCGAAVPHARLSVTMARMIEQDGYTLRLGEDHDSHASGSERHFVRVTLVRRPAFFGRNYNVRETRAQAFDVPNAIPRALGDGRLLAWRWQSLRDANALISHRLETLAGLGYEIVERSKGTRGEWDLSLIHI